MYQLKTASLILLLTIALAGCKKDKQDPNDVGGETNIQLTEVGRESIVGLNLAGNYIGGEMHVMENKNGVVTYHILADLTGHPDSALISSLVPAPYKNAQGNIEAEFKMKITSEGIVDYFLEGKPRLLVKYSDGVGAEYTFKGSDGYNYVRKVTEKTGQDDWPLTPWFYIKTSKIEETIPANPYNVSKLTYRANHRFGLVYIEAVTSTGNITMDIYPTGM